MNRHSAAAAPRDTAEPVLSARERAYDAIRAGILSGTFQPGAFIEEAAACEVSGVSRSPVREALNRLAAEGFLELHPRRGAMVRPLSATELRDLFEVRQMIERHAARRICRDRRAVPEELSELCAQHEATPAEDLLACVEINRLFHQAFVRATGNTLLVQTFDTLQASLSRVAMLSLRMGIGKTARIESEHRELIEALQAHDEARALDVLDRHLQPMPRLMAALDQ
ncbi:GntR family transcriptional regulator [Roseivivax marinus]|uniref:GntR family transcriptional regulator n=1 Tax=Roseivivax marinus TaxID=1379903 RepID=W4HHA0_9RHOB|nr:GntR family transcriptional regulator [Roseivivax marinus]ETW11521.1 GntR family transcriptional regulator [Roseivivax marinus]UMA66740.1 GntR family transcriptional regulator [Roseivivax marinus]